MSSYPENIDSFSPVTGTDEMTEHAERHTAEESSIVAIETALGTSPEGDSATVADRLDAQDTLIADNTQAISDIEVPDTSDLATKSEVEAGDEATLEAAESYTDTEVGKIVIPDTSTFATKTELADADAATLASAKGYTDEEVAKIVVPDVSTFATTEYVDEADGVLQGQIDAIETYDDTLLSTQVDANTKTLAELTTATLPLDEPEDPTSVFATLNTQLDANQYFAQELETKVTEGTTWGALAGRP